MTRLLLGLKEKIRFYYQAASILTVTISTSLRVILAFMMGKENSVFHSLVRRWAKKVVRICNIRLIIDGNENIQPDKAYIFVSNHSSLFDIPVLLASIDMDIRFMYKRELQKIPVFGWGMKRMPYIPVTRSDPRNAMASIDDAVRRMSEGASVVVFPEGTRSKTGEMGEFKRGAFMLAARAGKPIVPVALIGTNRILPKGTKKFSGGDVKVIIRPAFETSPELNRLQEKALMTDVRQTIATSLGGN